MILIVDDNEKYVERLIDLLQETGNTGRIRAVHNYNDAVRIIPMEKPQVVLLDMNMPGKSGIEVLRYIRSEGWDCKVIVITNHSNDSYRKLCLEVGADLFLDKSRDFEQIPSIVEKMIE